jgi:hypothetical protein
MILDVATLRYCIECLELQAQQCTGPNRTIVGKPLEWIAQNWRDLIDDCAENAPRALQEEIATLICIHENGIGTRELVEAQEGADHQGEWQSAMNTAGIILDTLRTREDMEATVRRVVEKAYADARTERETAIENKTEK